MNANSAFQQAKKDAQEKGTVPFCLPGENRTPLIHVHPGNPSPEKGLNQGVHYYSGIDAFLYRPDENSVESQALAAPFVITALGKTVVVHHGELIHADNEPNLVVASRPIDFMSDDPGVDVIFASLR